ncbi:TonB-dependent receptor [Moraxella nasicaprae]|uniref:TonB-dependent receptor n=1 Tax=Moraxella nasicaprae TaxID=2904122 RepID=A0ABY6F5I1_9GAMM|nr:TonB-dependent receptor [Moraxella nasicaprae]
MGQLIDQSQIESQKLGLKTTYNKDNLWQDRLSLTAGLDVLQDDTEQRLIRYNRSWTPKMSYQNLAPFAQARLSLTERLSLNAGVRYEYGKLSVDDYYTLAGYTRANSFGARRYTPTFVQGGEVSFDKALPSAGLTFDLTPKLQAFASYSQGLGMPDVGGALRAITALNQSVENIELSPIVTDNMEAGLRFSGEKLTADLSVYQSKSDLGSTLEYVPAVQGYRAVRSETDIKGGEVSLGYRPNKSHHFTASFAHTQGKYDANNNGVMVDMPARNISPNKLSLGYTHTLANQGSMSLTATHLFDRKYPDIAAGVQSKFDGYTLVDFGYRQPVSHRFGKGVIGFGVNNLLNTDYQNFISQTVLVDDRSDTTRYSSGRGRNYNLSYTFEF